MEIIMSNEQGELYDLLALRYMDVDLERLAGRLAKINRFNGATDYPYSVAQHSVFVASLVTRDLRLPALLHDLAEAFVTDLPLPIKRECADYKAIESRVEDQLTALGYPDARRHPEIKAADRRAFEIERCYLRGGAALLPQYVDLLEEITWRTAERRFMSWTELA